MEKLKPCPFCGNETAVQIFDESENGCANYQVVCCAVEQSPVPSDNWQAGCGASGGYRRTKEEAIAAWNRRAKPKNDPLTLDELRQMDGEPVWVKEITEEPIDGDYWGIVDIDVACAGGYGVGAIISQATDGRSGAAQTVFLDYAKTWLAYRTKPESEDA